MPHLLPSVLLLVLVVVLPVACSQPCGRKCRFRLCPPGGAPTLGLPLLLRPPLVAAPGPTICRGAERLGYVLLVGEALISVPGRRAGVQAISAWRPARAAQGFSRFFFGVRRVRALGQSVVVRGRARGRAAEALDGVCVRVPVHRYEVVRGGGKRVRVETQRRGEDCVAFVASVPRLLVELSWEGQGDDLDLAVVTPSGGLLSRFREADESGGRFGGDVEAGCRGNGVGNEVVSWGRGARVESGTYLVQVRLFAVCGGSRWTLRVSAGDRVKVVKRGRSGGQEVGLLGEIRFVV
ncbi:unnamed protein product [Chondrus crispus]|uniref:Uncharacterized protein n=1 Tax=Chondrus crispus TaxID=2769 RepID=R7QDS5_CHOCR|nr:unnamed protein product [Chondrus crispus]CDF36667.1 unnamed protein product [Chondrus crispus]|eukprot:XP_005716486.1 unnamed protein product [Chondrus crispus]